MVKKIFSFIISLLFFLGITIFGISFLISRFFKPNYYTQMLDDINIKEVKVKELGIKELEKYNDMTIEEAIKIELEEENISSEVAVEIIESKEVKEVLGKIISQTVNHELTNDSIPQLNMNDIDKILNNKEINKIIENEQIEIDKEKILNEINETLKEEMGDYNG